MNSRTHRSLDRLHALGVALALSVVSTSIVVANPPSEGKTTAYEESAQPVTDSWITTKVKADLLADTVTKGLDINVSTVNGVVTLAGRLDSRAQVDKAIAIARGIKGVSNVDSKTLTVKPRN